MTSINDAVSSAPSFSLPGATGGAELPVFYFDVIRGEEAARDDVGVHARDSGAAMREALRRCELVQAAAEAAGMEWRDWLVVTRDETRAFMFALRLSAVIPDRPAQAGPKKKPTQGAGQSEGRN